MLSVGGDMSVGHPDSARARGDVLRTGESRAVTRERLEPTDHGSQEGCALQTDRYREAFKTSPTGMAICDLEGNVIETNPSMRVLLGYEARELEPMTVHDLFSPDEAEELLAFYHALAENEGSQYLREQRQLRPANGEHTWAFLAVSVLRDDDGAPTHFLTTVEESRELHLLQDRLHHQTLYDVLTGLPNRQFFRTRLETAIGNLPEQGTLTLYHLGLDALGLINDGLGHDVGDSIMKSVARTLERFVEHERAFLARFGGTEFAILVQDSAQTPSIPAVAAGINEELSEPIYVQDHGVATSASIGVVRRTVAEADADDMMWAAEVALRRAEAAGKRQWALFDPDRAPNERTDAKLAAIIPGALELGDFEITYRPVLSMSGQRLGLLWAQLNWERDERGWLDHGQCLELAERSGVTLSLRDWMLRAAWEQAQTWHAAGYRPRLLVDLSRNQAQDPDLIATVRDVLDETNLDPQWLWLSVPMEALTGDADEARENVGLLGELGVNIVLHGFHASPQELRCLRELSANVVRFAAELVDLVHNCADENAPEVRAVAQIVPLVTACGARIGIDGVETEEQASIWRSMGCTFGAGAHYGEPIAPGDVTPYLNQTEISD